MSFDFSDYINELTDFLPIWKWEENNNKQKLKSIMIQLYQITGLLNSIVFLTFFEPKLNI